jgi:hypothetical protein
MGNGKCQNLWADFFEQHGATSESLELFFQRASEQRPRITVPPPMFQRKHELEQIEAADEKTAAYLEIRFGKDALAVVMQGCTESQTHISQDSRIAELYRRADESLRAQQEQERQAAAQREQAEAARNRERAAQFCAAFRKSEKDFGITREQVTRWLNWKFSTASLEPLTETQFAVALAAVSDPWRTGIASGAKSA